MYLDAGIVIPALNESASIGSVLKELIDERFVPANICVVDNGSTDDTFIKASLWGVTVLKCPVRGKGNAVKMGLTYLYNEGIQKFFTMDADYTYPAAAICDGYEWLHSSPHNVYVMSRLPTERAMPLLNKLANILINKWVSLVNPCFGNVVDVCSGVWCFPRIAVESLLPLLDSSGFTIEAEYYCKLNKMGYQIESYPFVYRPRLGGEKKTKPIDAYRIMKYVWDNRCE